MPHFSVGRKGRGEEAEKVSLLDEDGINNVSVVSHKDSTDVECIIMVGPTGTGKTSTVNLMTGARLKEGDDENPTTKKISVVNLNGDNITKKDRIDGCNTIWIDNPGKLIK